MRIFRRIASALGGLLILTGCVGMPVQESEKSELRNIFISTEDVSKWTCNPGKNDVSQTRMEKDGVILYSQYSFPSVDASKCPVVLDNTLAFFSTEEHSKAFIDNQISMNISAKEINGFTVQFYPSNVGGGDDGKYALYLKGEKPHGGMYFYRKGKSVLLVKTRGVVFDDKSWGMLMIGSLSALDDTTLPHHVE